MGKLFNDSTTWSLLWYAPFPRAKLRLPNESIAARTDDALVFFEFDRTYNGLPAPRVPTYAPSVSPE